MGAGSLTLSDLAEIVNEADRALAKALAVPEPPLAWSNAPEWQRAAVRREVALVLSGDPPGLIHDLWVRERRREGWRFGVDYDQPEKTDPRIAPWDSGALEPALVARTLLRHGVVHALESELA